ncbi:MAG TPA: hypothetical protein EYG97_04235 [Arcobacter sp.]|nr:hypothetical protein [Arcobacter sp.]
MNEFIMKIKNFRPKNEDWVSKTLKKRQLVPIYITIFIVLSILSFSLYTSYLDANKWYLKNEKIKSNIKKYETKISRLEQVVSLQKNKIKNLEGLFLDSKQPLAILTKVCELMKNREVIGSFYIIKKQNTTYVNVLNIEIQVSYGDRELLFMVTKLVLEKVFFLKSIEKTKMGLKCELYKPEK